MPRPLHLPPVSAAQQTAWFNAVRAGHLEQVIRAMSQGTPVALTREGLHGPEHALFSLMNHTGTVVLDHLLSEA